MLKLKILENRLKEFLDKNSLLIIVSLVMILITALYLLSFFLQRLSEGRINYKKLLDQYHEQTLDLQQSKKDVRILGKVLAKNATILKDHDIDFVDEILPKSNTSKTTAAMLFALTMTGFFVATPYAFAINSCLIFFQGMYDSYSDQKNIRRLRCIEIVKHRIYMEDTSKTLKKLQPTENVEVKDTIEILDLLDMASALSSAAK